MSPDLHRLRPHLTSFPRLEDFVFTLLSALVVTAAVWAVFMPTSPSLAVSSINAKPGSGKQIKIYGSLVDGDGNPIQGALIEVFHADGTRQAQARTKNDGTFSMQFNDGPQPFTISVTVSDNGVPVTATTQLYAEPGMTYGLVMSFTSPSTWVFVPIPGY